MRDGSGKWLPSQWAKLLALTLEAVDSVTPEAGPAPFWTFGGGTSLAIDLDHRVSYDIDAFLNVNSILLDLIPTRNPVTRAICWDDQRERAEFRYPGHYLKLIVHGAGEIDFLGAPLLLADPTTEFEFGDRIILRERPSEILAKKLLYRGSMLKARDVFDLAAVFAAMPEELDLVAASSLLSGDDYARARLRIETLHDRFVAEIPESVNPTEFGKTFIGNACDLALLALKRLEHGPSTRCVPSVCAAP